MAVLQLSSSPSSIIIKIALNSSPKFMFTPKLSTIILIIDQLYNLIGTALVTRSRCNNTLATSVPNICMASETTSQQIKYVFFGISIILNKYQKPSLMLQPLLTSVKMQINYSKLLDDSAALNSVDHKEILLLCLSTRVTIRGSATSCSKSDRSESKGYNEGPQIIWSTA